MAQKEWRPFFFGFDLGFGFDVGLLGFE